MLRSIYSILLLIVVIGCKDKPTANQKADKQLREVIKANTTINIDGIANEEVWQKAQAYPIDQLWLGAPYDANDFEGSYKLCWTDNALYALVTIKDDSLYNPYKEPLTRYWDDDCVEIFVDEDNSGGIHQFNHNAFAYHIDLEGEVVDIIAENTPKLFNDHVQSKRVTKGNTSVWEFKISLFEESYQYGQDYKPVTLNSNKKIGFAIAYCDNDTSEQRENFIGSIPVEGDDKNRGWIDASIFGTIKLIN